MSKLNPYRQDVVIEGITCACGCKSNAGHNFGGPGQRPKPGHIAICKDCYRLFRFNDQLELKPFTEEEMTALKADSRTGVTIQSLIVEIKERSGGN